MHEGQWTEGPPVITVYYARWVGQVAPAGPKAPSKLLTRTLGSIPLQYGPLDQFDAPNMAV